MLFFFPVVVYPCKEKGTGIIFQGIHIPFIFNLCYRPLPNKDALSLKGKTIVADAVLGDAP